MPQGGKKTPFSGKAKKAQLQAKRDRKANNVGIYHRVKDDLDENNENTSETNDGQLSSFSEGGGKKGKEGRDRFKLQFRTETKAEIAESRERAQNPIKKIEDLTSVTEMYFDQHHDLPKRPPWVEGWSKERLEQGEQRYFRDYVSSKLDMEGVSYFELNIETWRQFWRVTEMSDVLLMVLDIRYATATFPPALYHHVVNELKKPFILVLNKVDLIPATLSAAWKKYFLEKFPGIHIVFFTSFPAYNLIRGDQSGGLRTRKLRANFSIAKEGALQILDICQTVVKHDLSEWRARVEGSDKGGPLTHFEDDISKLLTIGTLGHPNVGKSSLINSLLGKKQASVSRTPGHTKHFQTLHLTRNIRLCDCPGLVFPSLVPRPLQILMGSFPISQVREPYSVVLFLAERIDLPGLLNIKLEEKDIEAGWTAFGICTSWADLRRYTTARTSRPDTYRAANQILRLALEGKICLALEPPNYREHEFEDHPDAELVREVLGKIEADDSDSNNLYDPVIEESSEDDDEEEESNEMSQGKDEDGVVEEKIISSNTYSALLDEDP